MQSFEDFAGQSAHIAQRHSAAMAQSRATDFFPVPFGPVNR